MEEAAGLQAAVGVVAAEASCAQNQAWERQSPREGEGGLLAVEEEGAVPALAGPRGCSRRCRCRRCRLLLLLLLLP